MKVTDIDKVLNLAKNAREKGQIFVPLFSGDAGLGKSFKSQQWAKAQGPDFGFIDIRLALMEAPDLSGLPDRSKDEDGVMRTIFALPEFLPTKGRGLILLEEPNRAKNDILNAIMQMLTDRKIGKYTIPEGWMIAACINPEGQYDVTSMDPALRNRFVEYEVTYDLPTLLSYAESSNWDKTLISFIKSQFIYVPVSEINDANAKYVSPRTLEQMNAALLAGVRDDESLHKITAESVLGINIGKAFHAYTFDDSPVTLGQLKKNYDKSIEKLKRHTDLSNYRSDLISPFVDELAKGFMDIKIPKLVEIINLLPADQAATLVNNMVTNISSTSSTVNTHDKSEEFQFLSKLLKEDPSLKEVVRSAKARSVNK